MDSAVTQKLAALADTLRDLPEDVQSEVLAEIENRVQSLSQSQLTDGQRAIVKQRLGEPREYAAAADVSALLRRFNPAL